MNEMVQVKITRVEPVSRDAVEEIANAAMDWLDSKGMAIPVPLDDERTYTDLAREFAEDWS